jgi:hypothetical protein
MAWSRSVATWSLSFLSAAAFVAGSSAHQDPAPPQEPAGEAAPAGRGGGRGGAAQAPRPYGQVITSAAKTDDGIFKVHRIGDTLFYEIPKDQLDKDFLWVTQIKKNTIGAGYGGAAAGSRAVRWVLKGDRVLLLSVDYSVIADASTPIADAVDDANYPTIVRVFNVAAYSPSRDPVIDVTSLFMTDVAEFSVRGRVGGRGMDASRSFLEKAVSFPENVNVEVTQTFTGGDAGAAAAGGGRPGGARAGMRGSSGTVLTHHSMVKLPDQPMMPRLFDERVGYFTQGVTDYGTEEHKSVAKRFITRYRLEKKDPDAALSEPVKPIVYYVDPSTPTKWVPFVKKGIEDWQPAFEAAGFKNAILAREAPKDDPDWSAEDARYSVIRWLPSTTENASGPHVHDPRTGEILEADIQFYHNVQNLTRDWYFVQVGPLDPRAAKLPLPDDLMGELMRYVVAHEVGHTLGFQHNMKSSSTYTIAQIRDPAWVKAMGHTPSLMDYSRFNYVAQPEDKIPVEDLIPKIGPYDKWATHWGYAPIPGAKTPEQEKSTLDRWAREQDEKPYLRFSTEGGAASDPGDATESVGDSDAVMATSLGLKNLSRVSEMLMSATSTRVGDPWEDLEEIYGRMIGQWTNEMNHVVRVVGGLNSQQKHIGQNGVRFETVARVKQETAVQFLLANAFQTPQFMIRPEILRRIQATGVVDRVRTAQAAVLNNLLQSARIDRMVEQSAIDGAIAYPPVAFLGDVRKGVWVELSKPVITVDVYRRNLQRTYLGTVDDRLNNGPEPSDEVRALLKGELRALDRELQAALGRVVVGVAADETTRRHLQDSRDEIARILDPRAMRTRPAPAAAGAAGGRGGF